jgi:hypothetical protein
VSIRWLVVASRDANAMPLETRVDRHRPFRFRWSCRCGAALVRRLRTARRSNVPGSSHSDDCRERSTRRAKPPTVWTRAWPRSETRRRGLRGRGTSTKPYPVNQLLGRSCIGSSCLYQPADAEVESDGAEPAAVRPRQAQVRPRKRFRHGPCVLSRSAAILNRRTVLQRTYPCNLL